MGHLHRTTVPGDAPPELVLGIESAAPDKRAAEAFSARLSGPGTAFNGIAFIDLGPSLLAKAKEFSPPIR